MRARIAQNDNINWLNPVNWSHPLNDGLVAWWLALPGQPGWKSSQWLDLCDPVNGHHGTLTNMAPATAWQGASRPGGWGGLQLGGPGYVNVPDSQALRITGPITLSAWFRLTETPGSGDFWVLAAKGATSTGNNDTKGYSLHFENSGMLYFEIGNGTNREKLPTSAAIESNRWYKADGVWDGSTGAGNLKIYIDGELSAQLSQVSVTSIEENSLPFRIGDDPGRPDAEQFFWPGHADCIRIHRRELSPTEVRTLYHLDLQYMPGLLNRASSPWQLPIQRRLRGPALLMQMIGA